MTDTLFVASNKAEIHAELMRWLEAFRRRDMDGIMAGRAENIVAFDVPPPFQFKSAIAYRGILEKTMANMVEINTLDMDETKIYASGEIAFCHFIIHIAGKNPDGGVFDCRTRATFGFTKVDGEWCVAHEHHSMPMPE